MAHEEAPIQKAVEPASDSASAIQPQSALEEMPQQKGMEVQPQRTELYMPTSLDIFVSFILTWLIGLSPAVIARYAIWKHPLSKGIALSIAGFFYVVFVVSSHAMQVSQGMRPTSHLVWLFVAWASYTIMRREGRVIVDAPSFASPRINVLPKIGSIANYSKRLSKPQVLFLLVVFAMVLASTVMRNQRDESRTVLLGRVGAPVQKSDVMVSYQDSLGLTSEDLAWSQDLLKGLEDDAVERIKSKVRLHNQPSEALDAYIASTKSNSLYIEKNGIKLAVIRIDNETDQSKSVFVMGLVGGQLARVACFSSGSSAEISIVVGACADKVDEVFGIALRAKPRQ